MFFWQHLEHDIHMLSTAIGRSKDDVCLLLHLILKNIATLETAIRNQLFILLIVHYDQTVAIVPGLTSREHRTEWEKCFSDTYIKPILTVSLADSIA